MEVCDGARYQVCARVNARPYEVVGLYGEFWHLEITWVTTSIRNVCVALGSVRLVDIRSGSFRDHSVGERLDYPGMAVVDRI